jgi:hypothetical protein
MGGGDQAGRGRSRWLCLCGPAWDGLRRLVMALQQDESALALLEDGRGLDWRRGVDMDGRSK